MDARAQTPMVCILTLTSILGRNGRSSARAQSGRRARELVPAKRRARRCGGSFEAAARSVAMTATSTKDIAFQRRGTFLPLAPIGQAPRDLSDWDSVSGEMHSWFKEPQHLHGKVDPVLLFGMYNSSNRILQMDESAVPLQPLLVVKICR